MAKIVAGIVTFAAIVLTDAWDILEDILDGVIDFIYDNSGFSHKEVSTFVAVATIYLICVLIDRVFSKLIPWMFRKVRDRKPKSKKTKEVSV